MNKIPSNPFWKKACYWVQAHPACPPLEETGLADLVTSLVTSSSRTYFLLLLLKHFEFNLLTDGLYLDKYNALSSVQFSRVRLFETPWNAGHQASLPVHHQLKLMSTELVIPSNHLILCHSFLLLPSIFPIIRVFFSESVLRIRWQSTGALASGSVLPMNIQDWFPLGLTGLISLRSKGLSRVFSNTIAQKDHFFGTQLSLWSNSHIHTWLLEKP